MSLITFLESLREPIQTMAGLPPGAVVIYAQQSVAEAVMEAVALHQCAVLVGLTNATGASNWQVQTTPVDADLEVEVWTPEVLSTEGARQTLEVAEWIIAGLHGYGMATGKGAGRVPVFRRMALRSEEKNGSSFLVANLQFSVPLVPGPRPA